LGKFDFNREEKNKVPYSRYKNCSDFEFLPFFEKQISLKKKLNKKEVYSCPELFEGIS